MIVFSNVVQSFGGRKVLDGVSFSVDPGEFVCITGPSGAGKSTIVQLLIGGQVPSSGTVEVDGVSLATLPPPVLQLYRRRAGVVFQDYKLLSNLTVEENVAFAMEVCGDPDELIDERVPEVLAKLKLEHCAGSFPRELSGGEQARTALARAIVHQPMILIADEPTGNIDPQQSMEILSLLKAIHQEGVTVVLASHDQTIVDALQTRVLRIQNGKIVRDAVGGYSTAGQPVTAEHTKKHQIFVPQPSQQPPQATVAAAEVAEVSLPPTVVDQPPAEVEQPAVHSIEVKHKSIRHKKPVQHHPKTHKHAPGHVKPIAIGE